MCSKLTQHQATATYREQSTVTIQDAEGHESEVLWLGHVRDDNTHSISEMQPVNVPDIKSMEHHGLALTFFKPVSLKGFVRNLSIQGGTCQGLFLLTESIQTRNGPDRWPVLSATGRWRELISKVHKVGGEQ